MARRATSQSKKQIDQTIESKVDEIERHNDDRTRNSAGPTSVHYQYRSRVTRRTGVNHLPRANGGAVDKRDDELQHFMLPFFTPLRMQPPVNS